MKQFYVYILSSLSNKMLYIGVTNNLERRGFEHKTEGNSISFTKRFKIHKLVYYEIYEDILLAIQREKQLKKWNRQWKVRLIETLNPNWIDLLNSEQ